MPETQAQSQAPAAEMTPAQSHAEIQRLLRAEIDALRDMLEARFAEIAQLTAQLEAVDSGYGSLAEQQLAGIEHRHRTEITLLHALYASWQNGPADGVAPFASQIGMLQKSGLFDPAWYLQTYPDVGESGMRPEEHYVRSGGFEGRNPGPDFDTMAYYLANPDVAAAGWPALAHYVAFGQAEGRALA